MLVEFSRFRSNRLRMETQYRFFIAGVYAQLRDKDRAFLWLEQAYENRDFFLTFVKIDCQMDSLRSDPRFQDLLTRIRLSN